jgi:hypothetical protein
MSNRYSSRGLLTYYSYQVDVQYPHVQCTLTRTMTVLVHGIETFHIHTTVRVSRETPYRYRTSTYVHQGVCTFCEYVG